MSRRAAFLDRDGTLNESVGAHRYVQSPGEFVWIDGAAEALGLLARAGFTLVVVSNQRGLAKGLVTRAVLTQIEARMQADLAPFGCRIEAFRYCPHDIGDRCACRKPAPGLLRDVARDLDLDLARSWMIGDSSTDVLAGQAAGCRTLLVGGATDGCRPDEVAESLFGGAERIASMSEAGQR